jgi:hypothetical protein
MIKATLRGVGQMVGTLKKFAEKYPDRVATALHQEAQREATEMKKRTPVDTTPNAPHPGNLRNSIHVLDPERKGRTISVEIATGAQAPYAVYVHENPDAYHPVGEWQFMASVLNESRSHMADRIARRIHLSRVRL